MIELNEALRMVLGSARPLESERVGLAEALNRILAEDVAADMDLPPFDKATVDGYACRRADLSGTLAVVGIVAAGAAPAGPIAPGQCAKVMTGAAVPPGVDCVVMIEQTEPADEGRIRFTGGPTPDNISRKAVDVRRGQVVLQRGSRVGPPHVAVMASVGYIRPLVARLPRVAVVTNGDELVEPDTKPGPFQIRNSNGPQLVAQLAAMGLPARNCGVVRDVEADIDRVLRVALAENDVVLISGGVSVGDFDLVPAVLRKNGVSLQFEKIAVKPGKPTVFGLSRKGYCFGLPGNPVSTFVVFELLVKPFLCKLMGNELRPVEVRMRIDEDIARKDTDRQSWMPVKLTGDAAVRPVAYHGSAHVPALCDADGLIAMDIGVAKIERGTSVRVRLL